jgi:hypothetical protein
VWAKEAAGGRGDKSCRSLTALRAFSRVYAGQRYAKFVGFGPRTFLATSVGVAAFWITQEKRMIEFMEAQGNIDLAAGKDERGTRSTDW